MAVEDHPLYPKWKAALEKVRAMIVLLGHASHAAEFACPSTSGTDGEAVSRHACRLVLEGTVAKAPRSAVWSGRLPLLGR